MNIIEKIEIKNFRSFGNRKKEKTIIKNITDLNIFSGANDSGKSNVLRALNLFFNDNTNLGDFFDFNTDFFKKSKLDSDDIKEELVTIKIHFLLKRDKTKDKPETDQNLPEKFWVSRKWRKGSKFTRHSQSDGLLVAFKREKGVHHTHFEDEGELKGIIKANLLRKLTIFLNSVQFHYIPAIKDKSYFSHLYGEMQQTLLKAKNSNLDSKKSAFQQAIQEDTNSLMQEFKSVANSGDINIDAAFELPNLINLFQSLKVQTGQVDLVSRGDGLQAKLIPEILNFIAIKEKSLTTKTIKSGEKAKKYFIWGFEEPENSYEYKNAQILANKFKDTFSQNAQIFLTTHSFNFLTISGKDVSIYRVWKDSDIESSRVSKLKYECDGAFSFEGDCLSNDSERLHEELGVFSLNADLEKVFKETEALKQLLQNKINEYNEFKSIVLVEDEYYQIYKIAWLKLYSNSFSENNFEAVFAKEAPFIIDTGKSAGGVSGILRSKSVSHFENNKIIGLFDFDKEGQENFYHLKKDEANWNEKIFGQKNTGHYRTRKDHDHFFGMLLPVPERLQNLADLEHENFASYIEIENLLPVEFLNANNYVEEKKIVGITYLKCKKSVKNSLWRKLFSLQKDDFKDFIPLFDNVKKLLSLNYTETELDTSSTVDTTTVNIGTDEQAELLGEQLEVSSAPGSLK